MSVNDYQISATVPALRADKAGHALMVSTDIRVLVQLDTRDCNVKQVHNIAYLFCNLEL